MVARSDRLERCGKSNYKWCDLRNEFCLKSCSVCTSDIEPIKKKRKKCYDVDYCDLCIYSDGIY